MNDETSKLIAKVERFARQEQLFAPAEPGRALHLCAAVSGGADSMALLRVLLELRETFGYPLTACHVNHGLRGETADRDEAFVRAECARLEVPLTVFRPADVGMAVPPHAGEDWARRLRYGCFAQLLAGGIDCIATAHTATDQAETLLFRLARGTGLHGAGGIRPRRPGYCRPLLGLTRVETEALCAAFGQGWVTDETNESDAYARNRLRHGAVPALRSVNDAAEENLARFCEKAARADAYFARQAEQLLSIARLDAAQTARKAPEAKAAWRLEPLQDTDPIILEAALHSLVDGAGCRGKVHPPAGRAGGAGERGGAIDRYGPLLRRQRDALAGKESAGSGCGPCVFAAVCPCRWGGICSARGPNPENTAFCKRFSRKNTGCS